MSEIESSYNTDDVLACDINKLSDTQSNVEYEQSVNQGEERVSKSQISEYIEQFQNDDETQNLPSVMDKIREMANQATDKKNVKAEPNTIKSQRHLSYQSIINGSENEFGENLDEIFQKKRVKKQIRKEELKTPAVEQSLFNEMSLGKIQEILQNEVRKQLNTSYGIVNHNTLDEPTQHFLNDLHDDLSQIVSNIVKFKNLYSKEKLSQSPKREVSKKIREIQKVSEEPSESQQNYSNLDIKNKELKCKLSLKERKSQFLNIKTQNRKIYSDFTEEQFLHIVSSQTLQKQQYLGWQKRVDYLLNDEIFIDFTGKLNPKILRRIYRKFKICEVVNQSNINQQFGQISEVRIRAGEQKKFQHRRLLASQLSLEQKKSYIHYAHFNEKRQFFKQFSIDQLLFIISDETLRDQNRMTMKERKDDLLNSNMFKDFGGKLSITTLNSIYKYFNIY